MARRSHLAHRIAVVAPFPFLTAIGYRHVAARAARARAARATPRRAGWNLDRAPRRLAYGNHAAIACRNFISARISARTELDRCSIDLAMVDYNDAHRAHRRVARVAAKFSFCGGNRNQRGIGLCRGRRRMVSVGSPRRAAIELRADHRAAHRNSFSLCGISLADLHRHGRANTQRRSREASSNRSDSRSAARCHGHHRNAAWFQHMAGNNRSVDHFFGGIAHRRIAHSRRNAATIS